MSAAVAVRTQTVNDEARLIAFFVFDYYLGAFFVLCCLLSASILSATQSLPPDRSHVADDTVERKSFDRLIGCVRMGLEAIDRLTAHCFR